MTPFPFSLPADEQIIAIDTYDHIPLSFEYSGIGWADFTIMVMDDFWQSTKSWAKGVVTAPGDYYGVFREAGLGRFSASAQTVNMTAGKVVGYSTTLEGLMGIDTRSVSTIHGWDRVKRTGLGAAQTYLSSVAIASAISGPGYTPSNVSTGGRPPANLNEQLALEQVKSNPQGHTPSRMPKMNDTKNNLLHKYGWRKRVQDVTHSEGVTQIHYVENIRTHVKLDFKIPE